MADGTTEAAAPTAPADPLAGLNMGQIVDAIRLLSSRADAPLEVHAQMVRAAELVKARLATIDELAARIVELEGQLLKADGKLTAARRRARDLKATPVKDVPAKSAPAKPAPSPKEP